jgi:Lecithin retinol acyltransferase
MNSIPMTAFADPRWPSGLEREPPLGAHLTTSRRGYTHHGLYVGHCRVVHYSGLSGFWQCGPVEEVSLSRFAVGHPVQIVDHDRSPYSPAEIVLRARSRIGENDYRLLTNNCEHFCNWCLCGVSHSAQVERRLRLPFRVLLAVFHTQPSLIDMQSGSA